MTEQERRIMWALLDSVSTLSACIEWMAHPREKDSAAIMWQLRHQRERLENLFKEWNTAISDHNGQPVQRES